MSETEPSPRLRAAIEAAGGNAFAVLDGAHFEDFAQVRARAGLVAHSLFLDHADHALVEAGPWLVDLTQRQGTLAGVLDLVGRKPGAVFWICAAGEDTLHRHLRRLNQVLLPTWAAKGDAGPTDPDSERPERVLFRHWDPNVLGAVMPTLDVDQFARVLGPAEQLLFDAPDFGGLRRVIADNAGIATPGPLRIRSDQVQDLRERRTHASDRRVMGLLRTMAPEETAGVDDFELAADVVRLRRMGQSMGLRTEPAQLWWSFLMLTTDGGIEHAPKLRAYLADGPGTADERMIRVRDQMQLLAESDKPVA